MKLSKVARRRAGLAVVVCVAALTMAATINQRSNYFYTALDKGFHLRDEALVVLRPGLNVAVTDAAVAADRTVTARFEVTDDGGMPLELEGVFTPGPIRISFILARIPQGGSTFLAYTSRVQTSPITNVSAEQPTSDSGGAITLIERGVYEYTFSEPLPADYDPMATHRVGFYAERDLEEFELGAPFSDGAYDFVPAGGPVETTRALVTNEACARCHDPLRVHGRRGSYELCITCHYPNVIDPDTGNSVDFPVMIHKIHRGEDLPSVQAGTPYQIIGFRQSVNDYSEVVFPQDHRNCTTCHAEEASQSLLYALNPTRAACGACHDDVNFATGANHAGGPQPSDAACANCHRPQGELEFDASVIGAHTIPSNSTQLRGVNINILEATHNGPGTAVTVRFSLTNDDGTPIDPAEMDRVRLLMAGPTTDYRMQVTENAQDAAMPVAGAEGQWLYTFETPLPDDASGSFAIGAEGRREVILNPGANEIEHEEQADNPVFYFAVTDPEPVPRRMIVDDALCETCHENLELHGSNRHNATAYCQFCHNPLADDSAVRPADALPSRSIDFRILIHRIHTGEELANDYTVYGFRSSVHNYNSVLYPGDLRNCDKCHVNNSWMGSAGVLAVPTPSEYFSPLPPNTAACLGCHDNLSAAAHAYVGISSFGESCGSCHGDGREFSVARSHAR